MASPSQENIQNKISAFLSGYFRNEVQKGALLLFFTVSSLLLLMVLLAYFLFLSTLIRALLFYLLLAITVGVFVYKILLPYLRIKGHYKPVGDTAAAAMIGDNINAVGDKLLNVVQLTKTVKQSDISNDLLEATIKQQAQSFSVIDFTQAIDRTEKKKYRKAVFFALTVLLLMAITAPNVLKIGTTRFVHYNTFYAPQAPFNFIIVNKGLSVLKTKDFLIEVQVKGAVLPNEVFLEENGVKHKLEKVNNDRFNYELKNINQNVAFRLFADGFYSDKYMINVLPLPQVLAFDIRLQYPAYLKKQDEELKNTGDLSIPAGTLVSWRVYTEESKKLLFCFENEKMMAASVASGIFSMSKKLLKSTGYKMQAINGFVDSTTAVKYAINVIPDLYPSIKVEQQNDSILPEKAYFKGDLKDDYGFSKLRFVYNLKTTGDTGKRHFTYLPVRLDLPEQSFSYFVDFAALTGGDEVKELEYYFEVTDNDGLVGGKSSKSQLMVYKKPSAQELQEQLAGDNAALKQDMKEAIKQIAKIQKGLEDLNKAIQEKKTPGWEDKQKAEKLAEQQKEFQNKLEKLEQKLKNNNLQNEERMQISEDSKAMQEELLSMMKDLKGNEEQKKLLEQLKELMEKLDKQGLKDKLENMAQQNKNAQKDLERTLEFYKKLELQRQLEDNIKNLENTAKKEQDLAEKTKDKTNEKEELNKQQQGIKDAFSEIEKNIKNIAQKDKELESPDNIKTPEQDANDAKEQMNKAQEELSKNNRKNASDKQKNAADKIQKMAENLKKQQEESSAEEAEENMDDLRGILENLISLSFNQEALMKTFAATNINNPQYVVLGKQQQSLKNQAKAVEDSLFSLSKRAKELKSIVNKESANINQQLQSAIASIEARDVANANMRQQYVMTSINNLALLLNEALQQMEQQQAQQKKDSKSKPGAASCKKPGGINEQPSESKLQKLRKMQEGLGKQMGKIPQKQGQSGGMQGNSEQLAKMAMQQMMIRNELNKLNQQQMKNGQNSSNFEDLLKNMDESAKDLADKNISQQLKQRQQDITTRLLEAEKAEKQREQSDERLSKEKDIAQKRNPVDLEKYKSNVSKDFEVLKSAPIFLSDFYRNKSINYLQKIAK